MAQGILESMVNSHAVELDSAGLADFHVGESADHRSIKTAKANGVDISEQRARQIQTADFHHFDIIYVMDKHNFEKATALAPDEVSREKVKMIMGAVGKPETNVPDPYYGGDEGFEAVYTMLHKACEAIAGEIERLWWKEPENLYSFQLRLGTTNL